VIGVLRIGDCGLRIYWGFFVNQSSMAQSPISKKPAIRDPRRNTLVIGVLRIGDCGLRIDWGFFVNQSSMPQSPIRNKSAIRNPQSAMS
jgi:hypothetical protein